MVLLPPNKTTTEGVFYGLLSLVFIGPSLIIHGWLSLLNMLRLHPLQPIR